MEITFRVVMSIEALATIVEQTDTGSARSKMTVVIWDAIYLFVSV